MFIARNRVRWLRKAVKWPTSLSSGNSDIELFTLMLSRCSVSDDLEDVFNTIKDGLAAGLRQSRVGHEISSGSQVIIENKLHLYSGLQGMSLLHTT